MAYVNIINLIISSIFYIILPRHSHSNHALLRSSVLHLIKPSPSFIPSRCSDSLSFRPQLSGSTANLPTVITGGFSMLLTWLTPSPALSSKELAPLQSLIGPLCPLPGPGLPLPICLVTWLRTFTFLGLMGSSLVVFGSGPDGARPLAPPHSGCFLRICYK